MSRREKRFALWLARVSGILFAILSLLIVFDELRILIHDYPVVTSFLFGCIVLGLTVAFWNWARVAGAAFFLLAGIYLILNFSQLLLVNVIFLTAWLCLTGLMFFFSQTKTRRGRRIKLRKRLTTLSVQRKPKKVPAEIKTEVKMGTK